LSQLAHPVIAAESESALDLGATRPADAASALFSAHRDRIREYCRGQLHASQEAEDALQSTFLYAYMLLERGVTPKRPLPWLYTIAHNVCRTRRRALRQRERVESSVDLDTLHETIGRSDPDRDDHEGLATALSALPATQRDALLLREWQGLSYAEIATRLCITQSAVETLLFRARRNLARRLQRTTTRLGSLLNGAVLFRAIRRALAIAPTKAAAAVVALGVATGVTVAPFVANPVRTQRPVPAHRPTEAPVVQSPVPTTKPLPRARVEGPRPTRIRNAAQPAVEPPQPDVVGTDAPPARPDPVATRTAGPAGPDATPTPAPTPALATPDAVVTTAGDSVTAVTTAVSDGVGSLPAPTDVSAASSAVSSAVDTVVSTVPTVIGHP
jgi:RNA polymerase sigma factor (sigma-70 family)